MSTADFIPSSLAPAVAEHVRAHRARGRAAIAACGWWPDLLAAGTVVRQTKPLASRRGESEAQIAARNERESYHYVHGAMSPFVIERGYLASAGEQHHVWAAYCGEYTPNFWDVLQGGAVASLFDVCGAVGKTAWLRVNFKRGAGPVPAVFRVDAWTERVMQNGRRVRRHMELTDGATGTILSTAEGDFVVDSIPKLPQGAAQDVDPEDVAAVMGVLPELAESEVKEAIAAAGGKVKEAVRALLPPPRL